MKQFKILLIWLTAALIAVIIASASAQDIDLDSMNKEQLTTLLQAIQQKLDELETETGGKSDKAEETPSFFSNLSSNAKKDRTPANEVQKFSIYENKKLTIEKLPDSMFIRKKPGSGDGDDEAGSKISPENCEDYCVEVCPWADNQCYFRCYYSCTGEPIPEDLKPHL